MNSSRLITFITLLFLASFSSTYAAPSFAESQATQKPAAKKAVKAKKIGYLSCKGQKLYHSKIDGVKGCYTCPSNMKRTSPTRKMDHPKACVNRKGKNTYAKAQFQGKIISKCGGKHRGFKDKNICLKCPQGMAYSATKKACLAEGTSDNQPPLYTCKGKGIYYSKVKGVKSCYACPTGMKRTSPTRKMDHPKACVNRKGTNTYAKATKLGDIVKSCHKDDKSCKPKFKAIIGKPVDWYKQFKGVY